MSRIKIIPETRALLELYAQHQGHRNLSAALATIVHHGVPFLLNTTAHPTPPAFSVVSEPTEDTTADDTISRLALLLEEF